MEDAAPPGAAAAAVAVSPTSVADGPAEEDTPLFVYGTLMNKKVRDIYRTALSFAGTRV